MKRYSALLEEEQRDFVSKARKFINIYMFILQITPFVDVELHKLFVFLRYFLKKVALKASGKINLEDKIVLEYYSIKKKSEGSITLNENREDYKVSISVSGGGLNEPRQKIH